MRHPEHDLQRACVAYLKTLPPPPKGPWWTAVAPLPGTSAKQGALAKGLGLQPGTPDLLFVWGGVFVGVELKAPRGRMSPEQDAAGIAIQNASGFYWIVRSLHEMQEVVRVARGLAKSLAA